MLLQDKILLEAKELQAEMVKNRRHLHENPELGLDLPNTRAYVEERLVEMGYDNVKRVGKAGLTVTVGTGKGKVVLLRGDMDALPIQEVTGLEFSSKIPNRMHACGHDMHTTMMLSVAKILKKYENQIQGTVKLMFQPGEEVMKGAKDMLEHGVLENPRPDVAVMSHVFPGLPMKAGTVIPASKGGPTMASVDWFEIEVKGTGGHGSTPYLTHDPLVPINLIQSALHTIQSRDLPPNALVAITVGAVEGALTSNVIPDKVKIGGTIRAYDEEQRQLIKDRMVEIVENISKAFRCEGTAIFPAGSPYFKTAKEVTDHMVEVFPAYVGKEMTIPPMDMEIPTMGSEDFALISQEIPTGLIMLAAKDSREGEVYNLHNPKLVLDEEAMPYGVAAYVGFALSWLEKNK